MTSILFKYYHRRRPNRGHRDLSAGGGQSRAPDSVDDFWRWNAGLPHSHWGCRLFEEPERPFSLRGPGLHW